jgi:leucyl aminopeptidase
VRRVVVAAPGVVPDHALLERAIAIGGAGWRSRTLATVPSNLKNPPWLAEQAHELAGSAGLECRVWDEEELAAEGFGGILGVGKASATPPRLIRLDYAPTGISARALRRTPRVVLVGKGITFDTGGLSIKPGASMVSMKRDMTGGAVVLSTLAALADVDCPVRVTGLVAAAENAISGNALRPGDVIRHWGGRTSEVTNTDAEGRLVLADALAYAVAELDPAAVVDIATLTGGIKVALGQQVGGLFANDDELARALLDAGDRSGEPLWRMPLHAAYEERLKSLVADADNSPSGPQSIGAALFLQHFLRRAGTPVPWAHLDIASVGDVPDERHEWTTGPSGFGARLLLTWLGRPEPLTGIGPAGTDRKEK